MKLLSILAVAGGLALPLSAQTFGTINGTATDPSGGVIEAAAITVTNVANNQVRKVQTNASGIYTIPFLPPGVYNIRAERKGFKEAVSNGFTLKVGDVSRVDFRLALGSLTESVDVSANASLVNTESTALGTVIENKRIVELPLNGRNYLQLIALSPNVSAEQGSGGFQTTRQGGDRTLQSYSIAGQRLEFNHYTLDGVENTDVNFNTFIIRPSIDALQEFKVQTGARGSAQGGGLHRSFFNRVEKRN